MLRSNPHIRVYMHAPSLSLTFVKKLYKLNLMCATCHAIVAQWTAAGIIGDYLIVAF